MANIALPVEFQEFSSKVRPLKNIFPDSEKYFPDSEKYFPDSGKSPCHMPSIHTPTKCQLILASREGERFREGDGGEARRGKKKEKRTHKKCCEGSLTRVSQAWGSRGFEAPEARWNSTPPFSISGSQTTLLRATKDRRAPDRLDEVGSSPLFVPNPISKTKALGPTIHDGFFLSSLTRNQANFSEKAPCP